MAMSCPKHRLHLLSTAAEQHPSSAVPACCIRPIASAVQSRSSRLCISPTPNATSLSAVPPPPPRGACPMPLRRVLPLVRVPGMINTHAHMFQALNRCVAQVTGLAGTPCMAQPHNDNATCAVSRAVLHSTHTCTAALACIHACPSASWECTCAHAHARGLPRPLCFPAPSLSPHGPLPHKPTTAASPPPPSPLPPPPTLLPPWTTQNGLSQRSLSCTFHQLFPGHPSCTHEPQNAQHNHQPRTTSYPLTPVPY